METVRDFVGNAIKAGDQLIYPFRRKSELGLNQMTVTQVLPDKITGYNTNGRTVHTGNLHLCIVAVRRVG